MIAQNKLRGKRVYRVYKFNMLLKWLLVDVNIFIKCLYNKDCIYKMQQISFGYINILFSYDVGITNCDAFISLLRSPSRRKCVTKHYVCHLLIFLH